MEEHSGAAELAALRQSSLCFRMFHHGLAVHEGGGKDARRHVRSISHTGSSIRRLRSFPDTGSSVSSTLING